MRLEWKRMLCNRRILAGAALLLAVNAGIFAVLFCYIGDLGEHRTAVKERLELFQGLETGTVTLEELEEEQAALSVVMELFHYARIAQRDPERYETSYAQMEKQTREAHPELAEEFDRGAYDDAQVSRRYTTLDTVIASGTYVRAFPEKLEEVFRKAEQLSGISIFQNSGTQDGNLTKTAEDYRRLEGLSVTAGNDLPVTALLRFGVPGILCLVFACLLVDGTLVENRYGLRPLVYAARNGRGILTVWRGLGLGVGSVLFALALYGGTAVLATVILGEIDPGRMAQSVPELFALTVPMNLGQLMGLYVAAGVGLQIMLTMMVWLVFSLLEQRQMGYLAVAGIVGGSVLLHRAIPAQSFLAVLKYGNIAAMMDFPGALTSYRNLAFGPLLVEKNILILGTGLLAALGCGAGAVWCGMKRYPVASHGKLYVRIQQWTERLSQWYHRRVARMSFVGLEGYKTLVMQRGAMVILVVGLIFSRAYPVQQVTYVGTDWLMQEIYAQHGGEGVTPELEQEVLELEQMLREVEEEYQEAKMGWAAGTVTLREYDNAAQKYEAYGPYQDLLELLEEKMSYIRTQEALGYEAVLVDSLGYDRLLTQRTTDRVMELVCLVGVILVSGGLFPPERKNGLYQTVRSTSGGREKLAKKKLLLGLTLSFLIYGIYTGIRTWTIGAGLTLTELDAPGHSLMQFSQSRWNIPIWGNLAITWLGEWMVYAAAAMGTCVLSLVLPGERGVLAALGIGVGSVVVSLFGLAIPTVWGILDGVRQCAMKNTWLGFLLAVALVAAGFAVSVRCWAGGRSGRR